MTAPDPGLTDLIAAHRLKQSYWNWWGCTGCDWRTKGTYGSEPTIETATEHAKHVVEQHTSGRHEWPKTTPTGFTYERPTTYAELEHMSGHMVQSEIEGWDVAERPPEPVWELVGIAQQEVERQRQRAEKAEATAAELEAELEKYRAEERRQLEWARHLARDDVRCPSCNLRYGEREQYGCVEPARAHEYDADELRAALEGES
ncbi:hypothetical protein ACIQYW_19150 [Rhodococcus erythropolis]